MNRYAQVHRDATLADNEKRKRSWWRDVPVDTWHDLYEVSILGITPHGDTQSEALRNIYYQARVATGNWRVVLSELEQEVYDLYTLARKRRGTGYTDADICQAVASVLRHVTPGQVRAIMNSVSMVQRNIVMLEDIEYEANTIHVEFKKLVKEVMLEEQNKAA